MCRIEFHALLMNNFEHRVLRIEPTELYKYVLVRVLDLHRDKKSWPRTKERCVDPL